MDFSLINANQHIFVFSTLTISLFLFMWGKIRHDFVALITLFILVILNIIPISNTFSGFSHPAVITVAAVLIIGKALEFSGLVDYLGNWIVKIGKNITIQLIVLCLFVAIASAFMNNVGALAISLPIALHMARKNGIPPSYILMPISFSSLLGGMTTLIGTPPNIIIAMFRETEKGESFKMFDFAPVGVIIAFSGILFISLIGWRLLPKRESQKSDKDLFEIEDYITEVIVTKKSKILNKSIFDTEKIGNADINILGLIRNNIRIHAPSLNEIFRENDIIIIESDAENLKLFTEVTETELIGDKKIITEAKGSQNIMITEAIVMSDSIILNSSAKKLKLSERYGLNLLAIARKDKKIRKRIGNVIFQNGDVLLLQGNENNIFSSIADMKCLPLARRGLKIGTKKSITKALLIFAISIIAVITNLLSIEVAFSIGALFMVLFKILPIKQFYTAVDWPVIILLGAMIPVGVAFETSGGAQILANLILKYSLNMPVWANIAVIMILTMMLSDIINNAATVVLMAPIAISLANSLALSSDPFLIAVAIAGSSAFLTPIGHQSNTLVMGPGGYKFSDYWKLGLPLEIIIIIIGIPAILYFWPL